MGVDMPRQQAWQLLKRQGCRTPYAQRRGQDSTYLCMDPHAATRRWPPVRCSALILIEAPSSAYHRGLLVRGSHAQAAEATAGEATPHRSKPTGGSLSRPGRGLWASCTRLGRCGRRRTARQPPSPSSRAWRRRVMLVGVAVAGLCTWSGLVDLWTRDGLAGVLGPALDRPARPGGTAQTDRRAADALPTPHAPGQPARDGAEARRPSHPRRGGRARGRARGAAASRRHLRPAGPQRTAPRRRAVAPPSGPAAPRAPALPAAPRPRARREPARCASRRCTIASSATGPLLPDPQTSAGGSHSTARGRPGRSWRTRAPVRWMTWGHGTWQSLGPRSAPASGAERARLAPHWPRTGRARRDPLR